MINTMTVTELKTKIDNNEDLILIDVREKDEWESGHIADAKFMPLSNFKEEIKALSNKNATIVCQCRSGKRSLNAATMLLGEGFENLYNLEGGILAWNEEGYPTV